MRKIIGLLFFIPFTVFGQSPLPVSIDSVYDALYRSENASADANYDRVNIPLQGYESVASGIQAYYRNQHPLLKNGKSELLLLHSAHTVIGWHCYFQQMYGGIPIIGATLKVNTNNEGTTLSVFDKLVSTQGWNPQSTSSVLAGKCSWVIVNNQPMKVYEQSHQGFRYWRDDQGNLIRQKDTRLYYEKDDTLVAAKVFRPDPLTPIGVIAGQNGTFKHFNDSDYALLNDQRVDVTLPVTFDGSVFRLQNKYARIYDTSFKAPNIAPATSSVPQFTFTRRQDGFKDVMALYHVTNTQEYLHSLGVDEVKYQLKIDAHSGTSDQSYFEYEGDTALNFGTGGVPDAEDADVVVHEFMHAVSFSINPNLNMSSERRAIEEGLCDVVAAVYSRKYAPFNWRKLFNWDAPNPFAAGVTPFWNGRNGNATKTYVDLSTDSYFSSEIWSSTLLDIVEQIGGDSTIKLMLASMASYTDNTTMPQAAKLFMQADSILLNKYFGWKIGPVFNARKMGNFPTGISESKRDLEMLSIQNSAAFANGQGDATLVLPFEADVVIYDLQGRMYQSYAKQNHNLVLRSSEFEKGMYWVRVFTPSTNATLKLIKF